MTRIVLKKLRIIFLFFFNPHTLSIIDKHKDKFITLFQLNDIQGYENEIMYISDDLKDGSYINQFKEIDYSKMAISNNQIGFNPEPKCSSGALPFVDVNVNYLLKEK